MIYPWGYTDKEGGTFYPWVGGGVTEEQLQSVIDNGSPAPLVGYHTALINGVFVHSLIFESAAAGHGNYARWDCINGWTTTIEQAKQRWPKGFHGREPRKP